VLPRPLARRALLLLLRACAIGAAAAPEACAPALRDRPSAVPTPSAASSPAVAVASPAASSAASAAPPAAPPAVSPAPAASSGTKADSPYLGATAAEVRASLGAPREVRGKVWIFVRETLDCDRRFTTELTFQGGRVVDVKETRTWTGKTCL
jgi:hypothetical protein